MAPAFFIGFLSLILLFASFLLCGFLRGGWILCAPLVVIVGLVVIIVLAIKLANHWGVAFDAEMQILSFMLGVALGGLCGLACMRWLSTRA